MQKKKSRIGQGLYMHMVVVAEIMQTLNMHTHAHVSA